MQLPIAFAINGEIEENILPHVDLLKVGSLEFREITNERYPVWQIKEELLKTPSKGVVVNAANEAAIEKFIAGEIGFMDIVKTIIKAYEKFDTLPKSVDDVFALDKEVRESVFSSF
jgi:1-deoxy-D-xylulose-5-phosphate reductoisomerase